MKHKYNLLLIVSFFIATSSFSQTIQQKIEAAAKDPKREENAAKADVFIRKNKSITDDSTAVVKQGAAKQKNCAGKTKKKRAGKVN